MNQSNIAIIGMACRFPGANTIDHFWKNLRDGVESITVFSDAELLAAGVDPALLANPNYVKAGVLLPGLAEFDADFFGYTPREAEIMDPQQRIFLECAHEALEVAGYNSTTYPGAIGLYAGAGANNYLHYHLLPNRELCALVGEYQLLLGNEKDHLPTRVSYKLNLKGPSLSVQTACSTSLVAVHLACQSLLGGECEIALAGGVSLPLLEKSGYLYQDGMILSPDGHCRAFDTNAQGTVGGAGVGVVVLKRLDDALADGDTIHAIIKGSAINNDGAEKVGYTAPSVAGQIQVIREAQAIADVDPTTIAYVETHGTGTILGDPIELDALTQAFGLPPQKAPWCALGSIKTNIGHADTAAGVASLIKTVLALQHRQLPPSLHFAAPNPKIDFANSPFYVNTTLAEWPSTSATPRRAGVSSFGIGGTNAHVIVEEEPLSEPSGASRPWQLLLLSAKTPTALDRARENLAKHLARRPDLNLADVAYTLQVGRQAHPYRRMVVCQESDTAITALLTPEQLPTAHAEAATRPVAFLFSGQGSQYVNMGRELYTTEPTFRTVVDTCAALLEPHLGLDLRNVLYPSTSELAAATQQLQQTALAQPALFVIEYALAQLWQAWGVQPQALIGHSIGEYVAACLAGVFTLEDALALVARRGQLMQTLPPGAMLAVALPAAELVLPTKLALAAINGPTHCVVGGPTEAITAFQQQLTSQGIECRSLHTSHAFHSPMMEPILATFTAYARTLKFQAPQIPYISNVTGTWITAAEATDPAYWANHLRQTVRFADGLEPLLQDPTLILLEVGPGNTLSTFAKLHPAKTQQTILSTLRHPREPQPDGAFLLTTLGQLWLAGGVIDWTGFSSHERRYRVPLPTYPFERQRYWVEPTQALPAAQVTDAAKKPDIADWFYVPSWERAPLPVNQRASAAGEQSAANKGTERPCCLLFVDARGVGNQLADRLQTLGWHVVRVTPGAQYATVSDGWYTLHPTQTSDYVALLQALENQGHYPQMIVHLWRVDDAAATLDLPTTAAGLALGFSSLLALAQALGSRAAALRLYVITNNMQSVQGDEVICPEKATVLGPVKVLPQEQPNIQTVSIDLCLPTELAARQQPWIDQLVAELSAPPASAQVIAYRGKHRWEQTFRPLRLEGQTTPGAPSPSACPPSKVRSGGVYLITGGLGGVGLELAEYLAAYQTKLILLGRSDFLPRAAWPVWLENHDAYDKVSVQICKIQRLEAAGAEVMLLQADVTDMAQMQAAVAQISDRFGALHGVIHAAGLTSGGLIVGKKVDDVAKILAPKVQGTLILHAVLRERPLDFLVLCSSLSAIFTALGQVDYTAATAYLDAFAQRLADPVTVSINWDAWHEVHALADKIRLQAPIQTDAHTPPTLLFKQEQGFLTAEGLEAFARIVGAGQPQVIVSPTDLYPRLAEARQTTVAAITLDAATFKESADQRQPEVSDTYNAPRNATEQLLVDVYQKHLGLERIGIHDNFWGLGGHSLLATQVIVQLRQALGMALPLQALFDEPTAAGLALYIATMRQVSEAGSTETHPDAVEQEEGVL